jgi:uncharacterized protein (TIGR03067 family)
MPVRVLLLVVSVALLGFAPAPFPKTERLQRDDPTDVRGLWEFTECESGGSHYPSTITNFNGQITKDRFSFVGKNGGRNGSVYEMRLDPAASPPAFTWGQNNQISYVGSYRLRKGELTLIFNGGSSVTQRPTDFNGKPEWRYVLRRIHRN